MNYRVVVTKNKLIARVESSFLEYIYRCFYCGSFLVSKAKSFETKSGVTTRFGLLANHIPVSCPYYVFIGIMGPISNGYIRCDLCGGTQKLRYDFFFSCQ
jgi:hypothetical protein